MQINFSDLGGRLIKSAGFLTDHEIEPIESAVTSANKWIKENSIKVINVETVILNIDKNSSASLQHDGGEHSQGYIQLVRVWHAVEE